ncbi:MAG: hypothetical protein N2110_09185 [Flavobacteriales bacterium]|nr:hypothetical protein [Flavobacteriales bacterium]MCX7769175.1 hypothetical protein [Flavobacteriales bacterium]MDW8411002.1 hypothetical protein [Flavobacteriales bacterium]
MKRIFLGMCFCGVLGLLRGRAQEVTKPSRTLFNVDIAVPFMLSNTLQREILRGLVSVEPQLAFRLAGRFYPGLYLHYGVWQSISPYNFKNDRRDIVMHHVGGGLSLGYLFKTGNPQVDIFTRLAGGFTEVILTGLAAGLDTSYYKNPERYKAFGTFSLHPAATLFLYLDEEQRGAVGFNLGARFLPYRLSREFIYVDKNSSFTETPDNGPTFGINFGISFTYRFSKRPVNVQPQ